MLTSRSLLGLIAVASIAAGLAVPVTIAGDAHKFKSTAAALQEGLRLYERGALAEAVPALEFAAADNQFMAQFTLAQVYSDNSTPETDHAKAYILFQTIADEHSDADPDDAKRAPYVAKSLTALAGYLQVGIPEIGLKPDPERAADYLHHAALFFGDEDAQFELVKLKLKGDGVPADIASAKHWLAVLTQRGHAGAQAFLADLYWRGKIMPQDKVKAFALISVAVEHAPPRERIWIEDVYQNIFCGAGEGIRKQATGMVADWRSRYGRKVDETRISPLDRLYPLAVRTCQNGDKVVPLDVQALQAQAPQPRSAPLDEGLSTGGLRDAGSRSTQEIPAAGFASGLISTPGTSPR
jgi:uncharacterized protein